MMLSIFAAITAVLSLSMAAPAHISVPTMYGRYNQYTVMTGYFQQDDISTDPRTFDYMKHNFGLIDRSYDTDEIYDPDHKKTQWDRFAYKVWRLNLESDLKVLYKVIFLSRHGEGYHNVAESFYGTPAWDCYWSKQDGNGTISWADARLTPKGHDQALQAHKYWLRQITEQDVPYPQKHYVSPLTRCLQTAYLTWSQPAFPRFKTTVKENLREAMGVHTCDRRSTRSEISAAFPSCSYERNFQEIDELWTRSLRESDSALTMRLGTVVDDVFRAHDTWVSITSHSGAISALLRAIGHRPYALTTGAILPVLVSARKFEGDAPSPVIDPPTPPPACSTNPTPSPKPSG